MKLKNVVLIGVVASIMAYLNNNLELDEDDSRMENLFEEVKKIVSEKLNHFDIDSRLAGLKDDVKEDIEKAREMADEISDTLISELNEAVDTILSQEKTSAEEKTVLVEPSVSEDAVCDEDQLDHEDLIKELESLLAEVEGQPETLAEKEERPLTIPKLEPFYLNSDDDHQGDYPEAVTVIAVDRPREIPKLEPFVLKSDDDRVYYSDSVNLVILPKDEPANTTEETVQVTEEPAEEAIELFDEDDYLKQIQEAIENTLAVDKNGEEADMSDVFEEDEVTNDEIDEIFSEIIDQENEPEEEVSDEYLESLLNDLKDVLPEVKEEPVKDVYGQINELYPYLSRNFVRAVYDLKEAIAAEYPLDANVLILHRLSFEDLDDLRQFTEIVLHHDYRVNVDEKQMIVDIFKECKNTDGKILTNIFEIANQAKLLNGGYEGYRVEVID